MGRRSQERSRLLQDARNARLISILVGLLVACLVFAAGFSVRGNADILNRLGFETGRTAENTNPGMTVSGSTHDSLAARVAEVQGILEQQSFDDLELEVATASVLATLADVANDPTLRYYDAERYAAYLKDVSGSFSGVGVLFAEYQNRAYVVDVFEGSEAEAKDVRAGDFVVAIDGDRGNNDGWTQAEVVKAVSRDEGASVVLTLRRPASLDAEGGAEYTVTLECSEVSERNVTSQLIENTIGYLKLSQITQNADDLVKATIEKLDNEDAQVFILDLRDNPGGFLTQSVDIASIFVKSGVVVEIQTKEGVATRTASTATVTDKPLIVLVNQSTAGTAEVLAGALQDNNRAKIVGQRTMGKGTVQSIHELSFGGAIRYTSAYYKTPNGYEIEGNGINPDIKVSAGTDSVEDVQLNMAVETAFDMIGGRPMPPSSSSSSSSADAAASSADEQQEQSAIDEAAQ